MCADTQTVAKKIVSLSNIADTLAPARKKGLRIIQSHGVFDLLHIGHIRHFKAAKDMGDVLVVSITGDSWVNKGPNRPEFTETMRAEAISALESVDYVVINHDASAVPAINEIRPTFYVKGKDYKDRPVDPSSKLILEEQAVVTHGGVLAFTEEVQFSSSHLLNKYFSSFSPEITHYLEDFRNRHTLEDVLASLKSVENLKVLVVGETIIDDYHFVEAIGKAGKEPILVTKSHRSEQYAGGSVAIANHVAGFCKEVALLTCLGTQDSQESFIRDRLKKNVTPCFHSLEGRPTIRKLRYLDHYLLQKLFEIYFINDDDLMESEEEIFLGSLKAKLKEYDLVIVPDYGHGMIGARAIEMLCSEARFLCVNAQTNAGNRGMHTISKYPRADYLALSEGELRLDMRVREGATEDLIRKLLERMECSQLTITQGRHGSMTYKEGLGFFSGPGFAQSFVDRIGSGDAVLSVTSLLARIGAHPEIISLVGNAAGAEAVRTVGHQSSLDYRSLSRLITSMLK